MYLSHFRAFIYVWTHVPSLVVLPTAIAITTHISASLSGWTVQVTVMECSVMESLGVTSVAIAWVTDGATGITYACTYIIHTVYMYIYRIVHTYVLYKNIIHTLHMSCTHMHI